MTTPPIIKCPFCEHETENEKWLEHHIRWTLQPNHPKIEDYLRGGEHEPPKLIQEEQQEEQQIDIVEPFPEVDSEEDETETEEEYEIIKLSCVTLTDDNRAILLNGDHWHRIALPKNIERNRAEQRRKIIQGLIFDGCDKYNFDYVSEDNVSRCAKEVVEQMFERKNEADAYNPTTTAKVAEAPIIIPLTEDLTKEVTFDDIGNDILSISIKKDFPAKVISFNAMLLAQTNKEQQNIGYQAESAAGKSYIATELATYFPLNELRIIATASPTAFFHDFGVWNDKRKAIMIDLRHKIIIFLDQPNYQLMERLRPLLSKDSPELRYMITDKNQRGGNRTKNIIIQGYASFFFCTAKVDPDEQEKTRMTLLSPSVDSIKLEESLKLISLRQGNPEEYDRRIGQDNAKRKWLMDRILAIRQTGIREVITPDDGDSVGERFIREHPNLLARHQRDLPRIFGFIKANALLNCFNREKKEDKPDTILATQQT
jgi:hypothetical protein